VAQRLGIARFAMRREARPPAMPADRWEELAFLRQNTNTYPTLLREGEAWPTSADQARAVNTIGDKPLIVLTGSRDAGANWRKVWVDGLQRELVGLSPQGRQVVLANSGHGVQFDAPEVIVDAIREVLAQTAR
jgi:pimeloyl-ACP methyl ester carboxylesterase